MSAILYGFARSFVDGKITAVVFSEAYIELWKIERDGGFLQKDEPRLSECLSSIFCAADMYCADDEAREIYEFDDDQLKIEISSILSRHFPD